MITKMTEDQEKLVPVYLKKWLDVGYRTEKIDKEKAKNSIDFLYEKIMKKEKPKYYVFLDSPLQCQLACNLIKNTKYDDNLRSNLESNLESNLVSNLVSNLESNLVSNLRSNLVSNLRSNLVSNLRSNLESNLVSNLISNLESNLVSNLGSNLRSNLVSNLVSNLRSNLESNLESNLVSNLISNLESNLVSNLVSNLRSNLESNLRSNLESNLGSNLRSNLEYFYSTEEYWTKYWLWHYDFILNELFPEKKQDFSLYLEHLEHSKNIGTVYIFNEICFISDFPQEINLNSQNQLHDFNKPALLYRDGYCLFYSNGVKMKKEQILCDSKDITKEMFLSETNVDSRRELTRKIGIEKTIELLGAEIIDVYDSPVGGKYELLMVDYTSSGEKRPYLKMSNPSMNNVFHIEGVKTGVKTCKEAIIFRNGLTKFIEPKILS